MSAAERFEEESFAGFPTPDDRVLEKLQRALGVGDAAFAAIDAATGQEIPDRTDERSLVDARFDYGSSSLRQNLSRPAAALAARVEKLRWAILLTEQLRAAEWMSEAEKHGIRWQEVPRLVTEPEALQDQLFTSLRVASQTWEHGQTTFALPHGRAWQASLRLWLFKLPDGLDAGPDVQIAPGVRLMTSGLLPLPNRGRFEGAPTRFAGPGIDDVLDVPGTGGWDFRTRRSTPPRTRPALDYLPEFVTVAAKVAQKAAEPEAPKRRRLS